MIKVFSIKFAKTRTCCQQYQFPSFEMNTTRDFTLDLSGSVRELDIGDYIFGETISYEQWLTKTDVSATRSFLNRSLTGEELAKLSPADLAKYSTIAQLIGLDAADKRQAERSAQQLEAIRGISKSVSHGLSEVRTDLAKSNRIATAHLEEAQRQSQIMEAGFARVEDSLERGFANIVDSVDALRQSFDWAAGRMLAELGSMGESLKSLVKLAENPSKVWALEQFDDARKLYSRGLVREAFDKLQLSLNGHGSHLGNPYDHKVHFLLGLIQLGSKQVFDSSLVDLEKAEQAFLYAARYSSGVNSTDEANSWLCAAKAAYNRGDFAKGAEYSKKCLTIAPQLIPAMIVAAKCLARLNNQACEDYIRMAVECDYLLFYSLTLDQDLVYPINRIKPCLDDVAEKELVKLKSRAKIAKTKLSTFSEKSTSGVNHIKCIDVNYFNLLESIEKTPSGTSLFSIIEANDALRRIEGQFSADAVEIPLLIKCLILKNFTEEYTELTRKGCSALNSNAKIRDEYGSSILHFKAGGIIGAGFLIIGILSSWSNWFKDGVLWGILSLIWGVVMLAIGSLVLGALVAGCVRIYLNSRGIALNSNGNRIWADSANEYKALQAKYFELPTEAIYKFFPQTEEAAVSWMERGRNAANLVPIVTDVTFTSLRSPSDAVSHVIAQRIADGYRVTTSHRPPSDAPVFPAPGSIFCSHVTSVGSYGVFVALPNGEDGFVHKTELASRGIGDVMEVPVVGSPILVQLIEFDAKGRAKLTEKINI